jgi:hypothetical protein
LVLNGRNAGSKAAGKEALLRAASARLARQSGSFETSWLVWKVNSPR